MKLIMTLIIFAFIGAPTFAHDEHNHEASIEAAPHGGVMRDSPPYKSELTIENENVKIYVYDAEVKPVDTKKLKSSIKGKLRFPKEKKEREVIFKLAGDSYGAKIPGIDKVHRYDLHVDLIIDGKKVLADFGVDNIH